MKVHELISSGELKNLAARFRIRITSYRSASHEVSFSDRLLALLASDKLDRPAWILLGLSGLVILGQLLRFLLTKE